MPVKNDRRRLAGFLLPVLSLFLAQIYLDYAFAFHTAVFVIFGKGFQL
jgi:hypothetical protein